MHPTTQIASTFKTGRSTGSLCRLSVLPLLVILLLLVFLLLAYLLTIEPLFTAKSSAANYEQRTSMLVASLENEPTNTRDIADSVYDLDAVLSQGVGLQDKHQGRTQDEPVLVDVRPEYQFLQELLPRPPPKK